MFWIVAAIMTFTACFVMVFPFSGRSRGYFDSKFFQDYVPIKFFGFVLSRKYQLKRYNRHNQNPESVKNICMLDTLQENNNLKRGVEYSQWTMSFAVVLVPIISWGLYLSKGSPDFYAHPLSDRLNKSLYESSIDELVGRVELRLVAHPDDWQGLDLIAPIYLKMQRFREAVHAYEEAIRLNGSNAIREAGLGEALVLVSDNIVSEEAESAFRKALSMEPDLTKALFFLGLAKAQKGNLLEARKLWDEILKQSNRQDPWNRKAELMMKKNKTK